MGFVGSQKRTGMLRYPGDQKAINNVSEYNQNDTMRKITLFSLLIVGIAIMLVAGCTSTSSNAATSTNPATTPAQQPAATMTATSTTAAPVTATPAAVVTATPANATTATTATASTADPILHRWIRQYMQPSTGSMIGYEFKFYPDGTVDYREGYTQEISGNIAIKTVTYEASGSWSSLGNMVYQAKILPVGTAGGAPMIRDYTIVPAHENKDYPGVVIATHIESSYELNELTAGQVLSSDVMYFPEQAKID